MSCRAGTFFIRRVGSVVIGVALLFGLLPRSVAAQAVTGTIVGTVTDASGGVIAGAKVTLTNEGTQLHAHGHLRHERRVRRRRSCRPAPTPCWRR